MTTKTLETIYFSGILPSVLYCIVIWGSSSRVPEVNKIHIRAARFIKKLPKRLPDEVILQQANWKPIEFYYKRAIACKAYKIYHGISPTPLHNLIVKSNTRSTRNKYKVNLPTFRYSLFKRSFTYRAANVWNNLQNEIREKPSFDTYKKALKDQNVLQRITFGSLATGKAINSTNFIYY